MVDFTYVQNVVHGHILAAEALSTQPSISGKVHMIVLSSCYEDSCYFSHLCIPTSPFIEMIFALVQSISRRPIIFYMTLYIDYEIQCSLSGIQHH